MRKTCNCCKHLMSIEQSKEDGCWCEKQWDIRPDCYSALHRDFERPSEKELRQHTGCEEWVWRRT